MAAGIWRMFKIGGSAGETEETKATKAHLGEANKFYYNEELKQWVIRGEEHLAKKEQPPPPPPAASSPSPSPASPDGGKNGSLPSTNAPPRGIERMRARGALSLYSATPGLATKGSAASSSSQQQRPSIGFVKPLFVAPPFAAQAAPVAASSSSLRNSEEAATPLNPPPSPPAETVCHETTVKPQIHPPAETARSSSAVGRASFSQEANQRIEGTLSGESEARVSRETPRQVSLQAPRLPTEGGEVSTQAEFFEATQQRAQAVQENATEASPDGRGVSPPDRALLPSLPEETREAEVRCASSWKESLGERPEKEVREAAVEEEEASAADRRQQQLPSPSFQETPLRDAAAENRPSRLDASLCDELCHWGEAQQTVAVSVPGNAEGPSEQGLEAQEAAPSQRALSYERRVEASDLVDAGAATDASRLQREEVSGDEEEDEEGDSDDADGALPLAAEQLERLVEALQEVGRSSAATLRRVSSLQRQNDSHRRRSALLADVISRAASQLRESSATNDVETKARTAALLEGALAEVDRGESTAEGEGEDDTTELLSLSRAGSVQQLALHSPLAGDGEEESLAARVETGVSRVRLAAGSAARNDGLCRRPSIVVASVESVAALSLCGFVSQMAQMLAEQMERNLAQEAEEWAAPNEELESLGRQLEFCVSFIQSLQSAYAEQSEFIESLERERRALVGRYEATAMRSEELSQLLSCEEQRRRQLQEERLEVEKENGEWRRRLEEVERRACEAEGALVDERLRLEQQCKALSSQAEELTAALTEKERAVAALSDDFARATLETHSLTEAAREAQAKAEADSRQLERRLHESRADFEQKLAAAEASIREREEFREQELKSLCEERDGIKGQLEALELRLQQSEGEVQALRSSLLTQSELSEAEKQRAEALVRDFEENKAQLQLMEQSLQEARLLQAELERRLAETAKSLENEQCMREAVAAELSLAQQAHAEVQQVAQVNKQREEELLDRLEKQNQEQERLERELEEARQREEAAKNDLGEETRGLAAQVQALQAEREKETAAAAEREALLRAQVQAYEEALSSQRNELSHQVEEERLRGEKLAAELRSQHEASLQGEREALSQQQAEALEALRQNFQEKWEVESARLMKEHNAVVAALEEERTKLESERCAFAEAESRLQNSQRSQAAEVESLKAQVQSLCAEKAALEDQLASASAQASLEAQTREEERARFEAAVEERDLRVEATRSELLAQTEELRSSLERSQTKLLEAEAARQREEARARELERSLANLRENAEGLVDGALLEAAKRELDTSRLEEKQLQDRLALSSEELGELKTRLSQAQRELEERTVERDRENERLSVALQKTQQELAAQAARVRVLEEDLKEARKAPPSAEAIQKKAEKIQQRNEELAVRNATLTRISDFLSRRLQFLEDALTEMGPPGVAAMEDCNRTVVLEAAGLGDRVETDAEAEADPSLDIADALDAFHAEGARAEQAVESRGTFTGGQGSASESTPSASAAAGKLACPPRPSTPTFLQSVGISMGA